MRNALRGLLLGAGYGLAVASFETWLLVLRLIELNLPSITEPAAAGSLMQIGLGGGIGVLLSPLLRLRLGWLWHLSILGGLWFAMGNLSAPESDFLFVLVVVPPIAGWVLAIAGYGLGRWQRWLPGTLGVVAVLSALGFSEGRQMQLPATLPAVAARPPARVGAPDVVLVVLDTVRAANVSAYGYERETTPELDALASQGALFLDATSPSTWSLPSHASLFTGLFPSAHGAHQEHHHLDGEPPTLAGTLAAAGYETRCFTANPWISDALGTTRGFDGSDEAWRAGGAGRLMGSAFRLLDYLGFRAPDKGGADVVSHFEDWLETRARDARPMFVFLNFLEAHFPYHQLPEGYLNTYSSRSARELRNLSMQLLADQFGESALDRAAALEPARDMYDAGILYADHLLGRVAEALRRHGTLDSTVLVVLSDHGELVGEHEGFGHGLSLLEPVLNVPLLFRYPPRIPAGTRVATPVSTVGVMASILDLTDLEPRGPLQVGSLMPALEGRAAGAPLIAERFADKQEPHADETRPMMRSTLRLRSYRVGSWKLIETSEGHSFLFDLASDPGELHDLAAARPLELARLEDELTTWRTALGLPGIDAPLARQSAPPKMDAAARERLRSLGYIE